MTRHDDSRHRRGHGPEDRLPPMVCLFFWGEVFRGFSLVSPFFWLSSLGVFFFDVVAGPATVGPLPVHDGQAASG